MLHLIPPANTMHSQHPVRLVCFTPTLSSLQIIKLYCKQNIYATTQEAPNIPSLSNHNYGANIRVCARVEGKIRMLMPGSTIAFQNESTFCRLCECSYAICLCRISRLAKLFLHNKSAHRPAKPTYSYVSRTPASNYENSLNFLI